MVGMAEVFYRFFSIMNNVITVIIIDLELKIRSLFFI